MNIVWGLIVTFILLLLNAFFAAGKFATTSTRRSQIEALKAEGACGSAYVMYAPEHVSLMLAVCQLGVTIAPMTLGLVARPAIVRFVEEPLTILGVSIPLAHLVAFLLALALTLFLHVVFAEMVSKSVSIVNPTRMLLLLTPVLVTIGHLLRPITRAMGKFASRFVQLFGAELKSEITAIFTTEKVASIVEVSAARGALSDDSGLLSGALEFSEESIQGAMVPLDEFITLESTTTPTQVEREVVVMGFSHFPITDKEGTITGYLHLKGVLYAKARKRDMPVTPQRIRKVGSVNAEDEVEDALCYVQKAGTHYALVADDVQRVLRAFFLKDVLEELVGEVRGGLQRDSLAWERNEERWAFGGDMGWHSASSSHVKPGSSYGTRGPVREGGGFTMKTHFSRG